MPMHVIIQIVCEKCRRRSVGSLRVERVVNEDCSMSSTLKMDIAQIDLDPGWTMGRTDARCPDHPQKGWFE
jgi:hypothetical protein